jgi:predicted transcriptional regulator of viral defense system
MGLLVRIKRNIYVLSEAWNSASREDRFRLANIGETPSYISLMTALDYHGITTQMHRDFFESVAVQRTKRLSVEGVVFRYSKIAPDLYFGFERKDGFFIACPEKAFLDAVYLTSYGRYAFDLSSIETERVNRQKMEKLSHPYPQRTLTWLQSHGYLQTA